jgi:DNA helicase IV
MEIFQKKVGNYADPFGFESNLFSINWREEIASLFYSNESNQ